MKILVTGGAGYIGSHTVYELIDKGYEVVIVDNLSTGFKSNIHPSAKFYKTDLKNKKKLKKIFKKEKNIEAIMHFAGSIVVSESVHEPIKYFSNNVTSTLFLLEIANEFNVKHFVFSSTAAVYGNSKENPISENCVKQPINPYGESKLAAEYLIKSWAQAYNGYYIIFRYFNVAGTNKNTKIGIKNKVLTHLIPTMIDSAIKGNNVKIFGNDYLTKDGTCIRDFVHVVDLAKAHIMGLEWSMKNKKSDVFNIGSGIGYSVKEIYDQIRKTLNIDINFKIEKRRDGDPDILLANIQKIESILKWKNEETLEQIIRSEYEFRKNR